MNKLLFVGLSLLIILAGLLVLLLVSRDDRFQLVENIEPQPLPLIDRGQPGWVAPNTLQASPSALQGVAGPGEELAPLRVINSFSAPLRITAKTKGTSFLELSKKSWTQPPRTAQEIGLRLAQDAPSQGAEGRIEIFAKLPESLSIKSQSKQREIIFRRDLELQIPLSLSSPGGSTPGLEDVGPPPGFLSLPKLSSVSDQLQPEVNISNLSSRPLLARGFFLLRGEAKYRQPLVKGQTVLPGSKAALLAKQAWSAVPAGEYLLQATVKLGQGQQTTYREIVIDKQGNISQPKKDDISLGLGAQRGSLQVEVVNNSKNKLLPRTTLLIKTPGEPDSRQSLPEIEAEKRQTLYQPLPESANIEAQLLLKDRLLAKSSLRLTPPKAPATSGGGSTLLLVILFSLLILMAWAAFWRSDMPLKGTWRT